MSNGLSAPFALKVCQSLESDIKGCILVNPILEFKFPLNPLTKAMLFFKKMVNKAGTVNIQADYEIAIEDYF